MIFLFFRFSRSDHPYFGYREFHSCSVIPHSFVMPATSSFHNSVLDPNSAASSFAVGCFAFPMNAFSSIKASLRRDYKLHDERTQWYEAIASRAAVESG